MNFWIIIDESTFSCRSFSVRRRATSCWTFLMELWLEFFSSCSSFSRWRMMRFCVSKAIRISLSSTKGSPPFSLELFSRDPFSDWSLLVSWPSVVLANTVRSWMHSWIINRIHYLFIANSKTRNQLTNLLDHNELLIILIIFIVALFQKIPFI